MRRALIAVLALSALMPLQAIGRTVTVRSGDTLSDIASRYGVSIRTLMRLNDLRNSDYVRVGQRLRLPGPTVTAGRGRHTVMRGESLSSIASRYRVKERDLIALNSLRNADYVQVGQRLRLPSNAVLPQPRQTTAKAKPVPVKVTPGATSHTVARGQTLTQIAKAYDVSVASLIDLNSLNNPNKVEIGTQLLLRHAPVADRTPLSTQSVEEPAPRSTTLAGSSTTPIRTTQKPAAKPVQTKPVTAAAKTTKPTLVAKATTKSKPSVAPKQADWRNYGPLKVDWGNWKTMAGSEVVPTLNADGQPLYLAVNCGARKINVTGANGAWKSWSAPQKGYERDLVKDRCSAS